MIRTIKNISLLLFFISAVGVQAGTLLIRDAKVYTLGAKGVLHEADIFIKNNRIQAVGADIRFKADRVIDAKGKVVTPGIMASNTQIGVTEIGAVEGTVDSITKDVQFSASFDIAPVFNSNSTLIPENRRGGVTRTLIRPGAQHQLFSGRAAIMSLNGQYNAVIAQDVAVYAVFGESGAKISGGSRASALARLRGALADTREYAANRLAVKRGDWHELSLPLNDLEALIPIVKARKPLVVTAHRASDILALIKFATEEKIRLILDGGAEAWMVAGHLARAKIPVIMDPMKNLPASFEHLGSRLDSAALLNKAGVQLIFTGPNSHNAYLVRQSAGNAVSYGLPYKVALEALISNPAKVFGGANEYGKIQKGYLAEMIVWDGDPLEVTTNANHVIIDGKEASMVTRSSRLRDRYRDLSKNPAYLR